MEIEWSAKALKNYRFWQKHNQEAVSIIHELLEDIEKYRNEPLKGKGNPEYLKYSLAGYMSRRIIQKHRLVYRVVGDVIFIYNCRWHYD
jgi:toxin YoeB